MISTAKRLDYTEYINSAEWKAIRQKAFDYYGKKCTKCRSENLLHVHHNTYKNFKHEEIKDLNVLCEVCHMALHNKIKSRKVVKLGSLKINKTPKNKKSNKSKNKQKKKQKQVNSKTKSILKFVKTEPLSIEEKNKKAYDEMLLRRNAGLEKPVVFKPNKPKKPKKTKVVECVKVKTWLDVIQEKGYTD